MGIILYQYDTTWDWSLSRDTNNWSGWAQFHPGPLCGQQKFCRNITIVCLRPFWDEMSWNKMTGSDLVRRQGWNLKHRAVGLHACRTWCWYKALVLVCGTSSAPKYSQLVSGWLALFCVHYVILLISFSPHGSISSFPHSCLLPFSLFSFLPSLLFLLLLVDSPPFLHSFFPLFSHLIV